MNLPKCVICFEFVSIHQDCISIVAPLVNQKNSVVRESGLYLVRTLPSHFKLAGPKLGLLGIPEDGVANLESLGCFILEEPSLPSVLDIVGGSVDLVPPFVLALTVVEKATNYRAGRVVLVEGREISRKDVFRGHERL